MTDNRHHSKPTTLGYFIKRLTGSGYRVEKLFADYTLTDPRSWTVMIDPGCASVICTCYVNKGDLGDNYFEFYDGGQFLPPNMKIKTQSIEVLIEHLAKYGIINKYNENKPTIPTPIVNDNKNSEPVTKTV